MNLMQNPGQLTPLGRHRGKLSAAHPTSKCWPSPYSTPVANLLAGGAVDLICLETWKWPVGEQSRRGQEWQDIGRVGFSDKWP